MVGKEDESQPGICAAKGAALAFLMWKKEKAGTQFEGKPNGEYPVYFSICPKEGCGVSASVAVTVENGRVAEIKGIKFPRGLGSCKCGLTPEKIFTMFPGIPLEKITTGIV